MTDFVGKPAWLGETAAYLTGKDAAAVRFCELPESFKDVYAEGEVEAAAALVVLWAKVQGAAEVDDGELTRLAQHMVVALGVESAAAPSGLDLGNRGWPVAGVLADVSTTL